MKDTLTTTCSVCGNKYTKNLAANTDEDKCFSCQVSEHKGLDEVTRDIMEKNPLPNCFFIIKK